MKISIFSYTVNIRLSMGLSGTAAAVNRITDKTLTAKSRLIKAKINITVQYCIKIHIRI